MKKLLIALAFLLAPSLAFAQCNGVFPASTICGNLSGSPEPPSAIPIGSVNSIDAGGASTQVTNGITGDLLSITGTSPLYVNKLSLGTGLSTSGGVLSNTGVTSAVIAPAGGMTGSGCTITTIGTCILNLPGGSLNLLRNASLTSWFHGCVSAACTITTSGGWCAEGVWVIPTGASVTCQQAAPQTSQAPFAMKITGASSVTDVTLRFVVTSETAIHLDDNTTTFQMYFYNFGTGVSVTPTLTTKYPTSMANDNWGSGATTDLATTNLQTCTSGAACFEAYTLTPNSNAGYGYEFIVDLGNHFGSSSDSVYLLSMDARITPGVSTGLNSEPPPIEVLNPLLDILWNKRFYDASYDNGTAPGTSTHLGMRASGLIISGTIAAAAYVHFDMPMRAIPSISYWDGAGNTSKNSLLVSSSTTFTDGETTINGPFNISTDGFDVEGGPSSGSTGSTFIHFIADATISGG